MKKGLLMPVMILWALSFTTACQAQENAHHFIAAMKAYKSQDYGTAIKEMERIVQSGVRNGALYYNLGNAWFKDHQLGRAVLWYERALKLLPNDPDLRFNADYASSLTRDATDERTVSPWRVFFFWKHRLSQSTVLLLAVIFNLLFWSILAVRRISGRRGLRHAAMAAAVPTLIFMMTALFNYYEAAHIRQGIVLDERVSVRSGLDITSTELFVLHAGAKIRVVKQNETHFQIRFGEDKIGWIGKPVVGLI